MSIINIGPNGSYSLLEKAIEHIMSGDFSERQEKDAVNKTKLITVIAGGLHTVEGVKSFMIKRTDIKHGLFFKPENNEKWYFGRKLQNGVILLKIPREGFQSKAANITAFPETYYKSGYLWKTLFPEGFTKENIIKAIDEALHFQDQAETTSDIIIGYTKDEDPFKVLKIRVQVRAKEIMSAFPTWGQPMTGNNGKPFSHIDAINTIISGSLIFFRNESHDLEILSKKYDKNKLEDLFQRTPEFLLKRTKAKNEKERVNHKKSRENTLTNIAGKMDEREIDQLAELLTTDEYIRYPYIVMNNIYTTCYGIISRDRKYKNAIALYQNLSEGLFVINKWDLNHGTQKAMKIIERLLKLRFINTGGLDQWEVKRLSNVVFNIIASYRNNDIAEKFIKLLSDSPCRIAFYTELNVNTFFNRDIAIIGINDYYEKPMTMRHFLEYVIQNLGINYTYNFTDDFNLQVAVEIQEMAGPKASHLTEDLRPSQYNYIVSLLEDEFCTEFISFIDIPVLEKFVVKPFEKEEELKMLKTDLSRLEREITIKIKERQLLEEKPEDLIQIKEAPVIAMEPKKNKRVKLKM